MKGQGSADGESPKDYVFMNKSLISQWNQYKDSRKYNASDETAVKVFLARQKKEFIEDERRKKNLFQLYKWDFVRQKVRQ